MKIIRGILLCGLVLAASLHAVQAQLGFASEPTNIPLQSWSFNNSSSWIDDSGDAPISFTNLSYSTLGDGQSLVVETNVPAWLNYAIWQTNVNWTNLVADGPGSITFWYGPGWATTNGGPGDWAQLFDVGQFTSNSSVGYFGLVIDPSGSNIWFQAQDGAGNTYGLSTPVLLTTNDFHFIALTYSSTNVSIYLDGQLATNDPGGLSVWPGSNAISGGVYFGSDPNGNYLANGLFDWVATYNYPLDSNDVQTIFNWNYTDFMIDPNNIPYMDDASLSSFSISTTTNLAISSPVISSNIASLFVVNSTADVLYEIQGCTNLSQQNWFTEAFVDGSELTNWTWANFSFTKQGNLFLRVRNWQDTTGTEIPDWWWLEYFGQTTNVNAYASDPAGDGFTDLQKYQMGLNPTNYYNPNPPPGFFGCLDTTGTNVVLEWSTAPGPVLRYTIQKGVLSTNTGNYVYSQYLASSNATFFVDRGAISNANAWNDTYSLAAVYPGNSISATDNWSATYAEYSYSGPPYGAPLPNNVYAYLDGTGTNVLVSWTPPLGGNPTNYVIIHGTIDFNTYSYVYSQIASLGANITDFEDVGNTNGGDDFYEVEAIYSGNGVSQPVTANTSTTPPTPTGFAAAVSSGTNVSLSWTPPQGITVTNYIIERGVWNTNTDSYDYTQIGEVSGGTTSFLDIGAIPVNGSYNFDYQIEAVDSLGQVSSLNDSFLSTPPPPAPQYANLYVAANLVRNGTGRWQVMFSGIPTNVSTINLIWSNGTMQNIPDDDIVNGVFQISDANVVNVVGDTLSVQGITANGVAGQISQAGVVPSDAPYFVDGRQDNKDNLEFLVRGASKTGPFFSPDGIIDEDYQSFNFGDTELYVDQVEGNFNQSSTNCEEFSFLHHGAQLDDLWPFVANYDLANYFVNTSLTNALPFGTNIFSLTVNFSTTVPAASLLNHSNPYWILQGGFYPGGGIIDTLDGQSVPNGSNWGVTVNGSQNEATLATGINNLFGLSFQTGCEVDMQFGVNNSFNCNYQTFDLGSTVTAETGYLIGDYASWCPSPTLQFTNYYFAPLINPNNNPTNLPDVSQQPVPLPIDDAFNPTNRTPPIIVGSVGQPMIVGGWAKYFVQGSANKYAYLGQYFETNCFLLNSSGVPTTTNAGILSPYGEFFPLQVGQAQVVTMPDIDPPYEQGTGVVDVISLNVDANHDGTMDLTYGGPDFVSAGNPFRFWVNDNQDSGDDGGNYGVPGLTAAQKADGLTQLEVPVGGPYYATTLDEWVVHGRRDLVDFFPVYLNIGSLFQSNALSAGINLADTSYQFILSQADSVLRFTTTDLTPTNYMNFLRDTNESGDLAYAQLTTITNVVNGGIPLSQSFVANIATNNGGIILVEAAAPTTQPLVLTVFHGTNQIGQAYLPLSISGVEQMFRSKTILLNPQSGTVPDRLTDAQVPNEPGTINANFVFLHGYNVTPTDARGVFADMFKRMYWSGSHAKFYGVTWEGADSKIGSLFTPNYHTNVVNAFATAPLLADFISTLTNSGPVVASAHSLGNMVTLSAISDWNAPINQYFMLDAAVPIEAVDPTAVTNMMDFSTWVNYSNWLYASSWYQLFPTNDSRSTLSWNNRLGNLRNVDVYNFYSSGEEVLRTYTSDPPSDLLGLPVGAIAVQAANELFAGTPFGTYTWYWQEKGKGTCQQDWFLGSSHGGWQFSYSPAFQVHNEYGTVIFVPPDQVSSLMLTTNEIQTNSFFNMNSYNTPYPDVALLGSSGSNYAQTNRNTILADTIPAMSLVAGANPVPKFNPTGHNIDMMALKNGWSPSRTGSESGMWHHSDFVQMAYTFTYNLFDQFVTTGNLK